MATENMAKELPQSNTANFGKFTKAFLLDGALWSYACLLSYKIVYQKIFLGIRYPDFTWDQPVYSLGLGFAIALPLLFLRNFSIGKMVWGLDTKADNKGFHKYPYGILTIILIAITFVGGLFISQVSVREFFSESGMAGAKRIFLALLNPNFGIIEQALFSAIETIYMAFIATAVALPIAFLTSFAAARNLTNSSSLFRAVYNITRFILNITRSIEPLVWAIIFSVWVGIGPFAGMLALCLHSVSSLAKLYSEQIENIDDGPIEAITATGAHPIQVIWYGVVPQIVLPFLSFTIYRWDINVRMATVIGIVGGGGIGNMLIQYQQLAKWNEVGLLVIIIAAIVWIMDYTSAKIREAIK